MAEKFGNFKLLRRLGGGPLAEAFLARSRDRGAAAPVVLKRLAPEVLPDLARAFLDRAEAMADIRHPNLAEIVGSGDVKGRAYAVSRWVGGVDLGTLARAGQAQSRGLTSEMAALVIRDAARGLACLHEKVHARGGLHLDVAPGNIIVGFDGVTCLADPAVDAALSDMVPAERFPERYRYAAPEVASGEIPDRRSDVFSLGLVLYELLCGVPAWRGETEREIHAAAQRGKVQAPSDFDGGGMGLDPELESLLMRMLATDPAARLPGAPEVVQELSLYLHRSAPGAGEAQVAAYAASIFPREAVAARQALDLAGVLRKDGGGPDAPAPNPYRGVPDPEDQRREGQYFVRYQLDDLAPDLFAPGAAAAGVAGYAVAGPGGRGVGVGAVARQARQSAGGPGGDGGEHYATPEVRGAPAPPPAPSAAELLRDDRAMLRRRMLMPVVIAIALVIALGVLVFSWARLQPAGGGGEGADEATSISPVSDAATRGPAGATTRPSEPDRAAAPPEVAPAGSPDAPGGEQAAAPPTAEPSRRGATARPARPKGDGDAAAPRPARARTGGAEAAGPVRVTSTPPDALVYIGGVPYGRTPLAVGGMTAGEPLGIRVELKGHEAWEGQVTPRAGEEVLVEPVLRSLEGEFGFLDINSLPHSDEILIDGKSIGKSTPLREHRLSAGRHEVRLRNKKMNLGAKLEVTIRSGERTRENVELR